MLKFTIEVVVSENPILFKTANFRYGKIATKTSSKLFKTVNMWCSVYNTKVAYHIAEIDLNVCSVLF